MLCWDNFLVVWHWQVQSCRLNIFIIESLCNVVPLHSKVIALKLKKRLSPQADSVSSVWLTHRMVISDCKDTPRPPQTHTHSSSVHISPALRLGYVCGHRDSDVLRTLAATAGGFNNSLINTLYTYFTHTLLGPHTEERSRTPLSLCLSLSNKDWL